jgi:hypothetical protein
VRIDERETAGRFMEEEEKKEKKATHTSVRTVVSLKGKERVLVKTQPPSVAAIGVTAKFTQPYEGPYTCIICRMITPSTNEISTSNGKVRVKSNKKSLKPYLEEGSSNEVGSN